MPKYLGGDITEISCSHPSLGDFRFATKADEDYSVDFGGFRNDDDASNISGAGALVSKKNRVRWSVEGPLLVDLQAGQDSKSINDLAESSEPGVWTYTHISGAIWKGTGEIVGDLVVGSNTAQIPVKVSGGGKLEKIN